MKILKQYLQANPNHYQGYVDPRFQSVLPICLAAYRMLVQHMVVQPVFYIFKVKKLSISIRV